MVYKVFQRISSDLYVVVTIVSPQLYRSIYNNLHEGNLFLSFPSTELTADCVLLKEVINNHLQYYGFLSNGKLVLCVEVYVSIHFSITLYNRVKNLKV